MELSQGEIIQKPKMQELSSLFMTHHINVMHALVKFHEYIFHIVIVSRPRQTSKVMSGLSVNLTTLFPGQA